MTKNPFLKGTGFKTTDVSTRNQTSFMKHASSPVRYDAGREDQDADFKR